MQKTQTKIKKIKLHILSIIILVITSGLVAFAWYDNNEATSAKGNNSIKVTSSGALQIAFAENEAGQLLLPQKANYSDSITMQLYPSGFDDVTGSGIKLYSPVLIDENNPDVDISKWTEETSRVDGKTEAGADRASCGTDSGKYILLDIFFKSDVPMDIYITDNSFISPKTNSEGNDLVNKKGYETKTQYVHFENGLPSLNINQSSFGLFSRNLIAGATRVAFCNYSISQNNNVYEYNLKSYPDLVWVPNSSYELVSPKDSSFLYQFYMNSGNKEPSYSYYEIEDGKLKKYIIPRINGRISGLLRRKTDDGSVLVPNYMVDNSNLVPAVISNGQFVPAMFDGSSYIPALYYKDSSKNQNYYKAQYDGYNSAAFCLLNGTFARFENGLFYKVILDDGLWTKIIAGYGADKKPIYVTMTEDEVLPLMIKDETEYIQTNWMEDDEFVQSLHSSDKISKTRIASTDFCDESDGTYYGRARIAIWVEGTDREAKLPLNGGEFDINLAFVGISQEQN